MLRWVQLRLSGTCDKKKLSGEKSLLQSSSFNTYVTVAILVNICSWGATENPTEKCWRVTKTLTGSSDECEVSRDKVQSPRSECRDWLQVIMECESWCCVFMFSLFVVQRLRSIKPWSGIGWTEPRNEATMGMVDIRKTLHGYVGGVKMRDSLLNN